jgi:hypothetical protein
MHYFGKKLKPDATQALCACHWAVNHLEYGTKKNRLSHGTDRQITGG